MSLFDDAMLQEDDLADAQRQHAAALCGRANQILVDRGLLSPGEMFFYPSQGGAMILSRSTPARFDQFVIRLEDLV